MDTLNLKKMGPRKWRVRFKYTDPLTGRRKVYQKTLNDVTVNEARVHRDQAKAACQRGEHGRRPGQRLRAFVDSFMTARGRKGRGGKPLRSSTLERDAFAIDNHILPEAGDWLVTEITRADVERLVDGWCRKKKPVRKKNKKGEIVRDEHGDAMWVEGPLYSRASINTWLKTLKLFLGYCASMCGTENPAADVDALATSKSNRTALTTDQVRKLLTELKNSHPQHWAFCVVGFSTGARFSEISALRWKDVDRESQVLRFEHSQSLGRRHEGDKTHRTWTFPLLPELDEALQWHRQRMLSEQHPGLATDLVFPARVYDVEEAVYNGHMSSSTIRAALASACEKVELPRITPHDMRVTFQTLCVQSGIPGEIVRTVTGHSTERMSAHYTRPHHDAQVRAFGPIAEGFAGELVDGDGDEEQGTGVNDG